MDREEEIGRQAVGAFGPRGQTGPLPVGGDHEHGLGEAGGDEILLDAFGEAEVEIVFAGTARALGADLLLGVSDVHDHLKRCGVALGRFRLAPGPARRLTQRGVEAGVRQQHRQGDTGNRSDGW
jgi:hypothetical protein